MGCLALNEKQQTLGAVLVPHEKELVLCVSSISSKLLHSGLRSISVSLLHGGPCRQFCALRSGQQ